MFVQKIRQMTAVFFLQLTIICELVNQSSDLQFDQRQMNNPFNTIQDRSLIREGLQMPGFFHDMVMPVVETIQSGKSQLYW